MNLKLSCIAVLFSVAFNAATHASPIFEFPDPVGDILTGVPGTGTSSS